MIHYQRREVTNYKVDFSPQYLYFTWVFIFLTTCFVTLTPCIFTQISVLSTHYIGKKNTLVNLCLKVFKTYRIWQILVLRDLSSVQIVHSHSFCKIINPSIVSLMVKKKKNLTQVNLKWNKWNQYLFFTRVFYYFYYFKQVSYFHLSKYKVATSVQVLSL